MALTAKLKLTKMNPDYTGACGQYSTVTEIIDLDYNPGFTLSQVVPFTIDESGTVSNYDVRSIKPECDLVTLDTVITYNMCNIGVQQPEPVVE